MFCIVLRFEPRAHKNCINLSASESDDINQILAGPAPKSEKGYNKRTRKRRSKCLCEAL